MCGTVYTVTDFEKLNEDEKNNFDINMSLEISELNLVIDFSSCSNETRYINHSCKPNVSTRMMYDPKSQQSELWIYSLQDILVDNEITLDYGSKPEICCCTFCCQSGI